VTNITRSIAFDRDTSGGGTSNDSEDRLTSQTGTPLRSRVGSSSYTEGELKGEIPIIHSIAHEAKYLKGCGINADQVKAFIQVLERYKNNREYSIGGVRSYIDEAATKMIL